ncbi:MAG: iron ABC transporter permease [Crocinitomicaceae bacterium]|nr:iron ABC transporter permease [Crocinitomicaceae bacterium]
MTKSVKYHFLLSVLLIVLLLWDVTLGSVAIRWDAIWDSIFHYDQTATDQLTLRLFRFPRVITALLAGAALSLAGLMMQTLFQNPLAGPYVLGINSGASLFVALITMSNFTFMTGKFGIVTAALIGAMLTGIFILFCALYLKNKISLLLVGVMFGSFAGALVNIIQTYSNPEDIKMFVIWSFGSLQQTELSDLPYLGGLVLIGALCALLLTKPLNLLLLGDKEAKLLGVNVAGVRFYIVLVTAILTGVVTAYCGPIAFIGLIAPNLVKLMYRTANHLHLVIGSLLLGAFLVVFCDVIMQLAQPIITIPLNALTAFLGAPLVMWIIIKRF